jgi:hypothetical protein
MLKSPEDFDRLMRMELELSHDPSAAGRAGHLQITARKPQASS